MNIFVTKIRLFMAFFIRINGCGNAWPILIGTTHPFYSIENINDLYNTSFSIIKTSTELFDINNIEWEILIDAGLGSIYNIIQNENRLPDAVFLTHAHPDHCAGLEWIVQSNYRIYGKSDYPVYCSSGCYKHLVMTFPHISKFISFKELKPANEIIINNYMSVIQYPVFHGNSALGSSMFLFNINSSKILFTGDILCPLITKTDIYDLKGTKYLFTDCNNRFPYPRTNHWSFMRNNAKEFLNDFLREINFEILLKPHISNQVNNSINEYFNNIETEKDIKSHTFTIIDFCKRILPENIVLVHYSGIEDKKYYNEPLLSKPELQSWANIKAVEEGLNTKIIVPLQGEIFEI